jgi:hypothetical protein
MESSGHGHRFLVLGSVRHNADGQQLTQIKNTRWPRGACGVGPAVTGDGRESAGATQGSVRPTPTPNVRSAVERGQLELRTPPPNAPVLALATIVRLSLLQSSASHRNEGERGGTHGKRARRTS